MRPSAFLALVLCLVAAACAAARRQVPDAAALTAAQAEAYLAAAAALDAGDALGALDAVRPALAAEPPHVPSHVLAQDAMSLLGRETEAAADARRAAERAPADAARALLAARLTARTDGAREAAYRAVVAADASSAWPRIALAYELVRAARDESARATTLADGGFPGPASEATARAEALGAEADALARAVVAARGDLASAHGCLADVLLGTRGTRGRRVAEALAAAETAARLDPGTAATWFRVGRARRESSDDAGAAEALARAAELAPRDGAARAALGRVLLDLSRDTAALAELTEAEALDPAAVAVKLDRGAAEFRLALFDAAADTFARAARAAPADPRAHEGQALALARIGRRADAAAAMERYLAAGGADRDAARRFIEEERAGGPGR